DDLARRQIKVDALQNGSAGAGEMHVARAEQNVRPTRQRAGVPMMMVIVPVRVMTARSMRVMHVHVRAHAGDAAQLAQTPVTSSMTRVVAKPAASAARSIASNAVAAPTSATVVQRSQARTI